MDWGRGMTHSVSIYQCLLFAISEIGTRTLGWANQPESLWVELTAWWGTCTFNT